MPFSLTYLILSISLIYLAAEKNKQNKRRCNHKFADRDTSSRIAHK